MTTLYDEDANRLIASLEHGCSREEFERRVRAAKARIDALEPKLPGEQTLEVTWKQFSKLIDLSYACSRLTYAPDGVTIVTTMDSARWVAAVETILGRKLAFGNYHLKATR